MCPETAQDAPKRAAPEPREARRPKLSYRMRPDNESIRTAPVLAAVGPMQFEVAVHRMAAELSAPIVLESLPYQVARIWTPPTPTFMDKQVSAEVLTRTDGVMLVLFSTP